MINFKYLSSGNEERLYKYLNGLANGNGCLCNKSYIKFTHCVSNAPPVDIFLDGQLVGKSIVLGQSTDYVLVYPGVCSVAVYIENTNNNIIYYENVNISRNQAYSCFLAGNADNISLVTVTENKEENPATRSSVIQFTNCVLNNKGLDVYKADKVKLFSNVRFGESTSSIRIKPGRTSFYVKYNGNRKIEAISKEAFLNKNTYYLLYAYTKKNGDISIEIRESGINYLDLCWYIRTIMIKLKKIFEKCF